MKEVKVYTAQISRDGEVKNEFQSFYQKLSDDDKLLEEITWSADNEIESKTVFEYDSSGRLIKEMNYYDDEEFSDGRELKYNNHDQLAEVRIKYSDGSETLQVYERSAHLTRISFYNEDNELEYVEERKTNDHNNLTEFRKTGFDGNEEHVIQLLYDEYDRLIQTNDRNIAEDFNSIARIEYNAQNNPVKEVVFTEKGNIISSREYRYNEQNEVVAEIVNDYVISYTINDQGERTERKVTNPSGQLEELTTYIHDETGRLTEERFYKSNDLNKQDIFMTAYIRKRYEY